MTVSLSMLSNDNIMSASGTSSAVSLSMLSNDSIMSASGMSSAVSLSMLSNDSIMSASGTSSAVSLSMPSNDSIMLASGTSSAVSADSGVLNPVNQRIDKVVLLSVGSRQPVGLGKLCKDQDKIHGHEIPHDHVKVLIEYIKPNIPPPFPLPFDGNELDCGQFSVWPKQFITS